MRLVQRQYNYDVAILHTDRESGFGNELGDICHILGIVLEDSPPGTSEANGLIEDHNLILQL